jgi:hypothetical protein
LGGAGSVASDKQCYFMLNGGYLSVIK